TGRRLATLTLHEDTAAAGIGDLERALSLPLTQQGIDVRLIERDQLREVRELEVCLQQVRSRSLDDVQRCFEMLSRAGRISLRQSGLRKPGMCPPRHRRRNVLRAERLLIQA